MRERKQAKTQTIGNDAEWVTRELFFIDTITFIFRMKALKHLKSCLLKKDII